MRKHSILWVWLACLGLAAAGWAQSGIQLQGGAGQDITFTGMGAGSSALAVTLGSCGLVNTCWLYGTGQGTGALASEGVFLLQSTPGSLQMTSTGNGSFLLHSPSPIQMPYFGISGSGQAGLLLTGDLNLVNFNTIAGSRQGAFSGGSLTVTGGALAGATSSAGLGVTLNVLFPCSSNLKALMGTSGSLTAMLAGGSLGQLSPTPEPAGLWLAGLGLLVLGFAYGRKRRWPRREA
ncbi:MAG: PEP-CTERM sorting domain-containing protein [Terriglobales bacterium]